MTFEATFILTVLGAAIVWAILRGGLLPRRYSGRDCQGPEWKRSFPSASNDQIRAFLITFVDAFAFKRTEKLKLNPGDQVLDIYRTLYPSKEMPDAMELETLAVDLRRNYGLNLSAIWNDRLTLGELFEHAVLKRIASA
jgi:hypothetical protein